MHPAIKTRRAGGFSIVESVIASAALAMFLTGLFGISTQSLRWLRMAEQQSAASFCLQQRIEEMRRLTWSQLTDSSYLCNNILNRAPGAATALPNSSEQITLNVFPTATTATIVTRPASGSATVQASNSSLSTASVLRIDVLVSWTMSNGGTNSRQFTTVVAQGGIQ